MAELEILQALVSFFCPTSEAASTCNEFIQNHSQILPPIGPLFYFLLFPAVFTILFILLLMDNVGVAKNRSWGIKVLLGITAFIFIIISGWYPIMLILSEFWYIIIILLGFLWFVTGHRSKKEGGGGGGPSGKMSAISLGGVLSKATEKEIRILTGEIPKLEADIERVLKKMNDLAVPIKSNPNDSRAWSLYSQEEEKYLALKKIYEDELRVIGAPKGRKLEHFNKEETKILEMVAHARKNVS